MSVNRFDHLARLLAQGTSRRQILKGFAAGLGASLFSTFNIGSTPGHQQIAEAAAPAVSTNGSFLPFILAAGTPAICAIPSKCQSNVICSADDQSCRCIESAEGNIHCGVVPSCSAPTCTKSADCAHLGTGYFCDAEGSGCCGKQLCIAPCPKEAPCPDELICGGKCCPPNNTCKNGACVDPVNGTWTGTLTYEGQSIGIQFVLSQRIGEIEGRILLQDPVNHTFLETGPVSGLTERNTQI